MFGPNYNDFPEAVELINKNIAYCFNNSLELLSIINELSENKLLEEKKEKARNYVLENKGPTSMVMKAVKELINHSKTSASSKI